MPSESRSPASMLVILLSWYAVASAMLTARAGSPRRTPIAAMRAAFSDCSVLSVTSCPPTDAVHPSGSGSGPAPFQRATPIAPMTVSKARPRSAAFAPRRISGPSVAVQGGVELDACPLGPALPRHRLDGPGDRVAPEQHVAGARE